jgi:hypothetical protein
MGWKRFRSRLGFINKEPERTLLFIGTEAAAFEPLAYTIGEMIRRDSRLRIVLSGSDPKMLEWLKARFPGFLVLPLPFSNRISAELYLRRLKIRGVAFIESNPQLPVFNLLAAMKRLAIGIVTISGRSAKELSQEGTVQSMSEARVLLREGPGQIVVPSNVTCMTVTELADRFGMMLARDLKALREPNLFSRALAGLPATLAVSPRWRGAVAWRIRRYKDQRELKDRLVSPKSIMCLGNGPSSEEAILGSLKKDVLFRVNHSWINRGFLTDADVIFTGGKPSMRAISGAIFGVPTADAERNLLLLRGYNPMFGRVEFFNVNDVTQSIKNYNWGHLRPTNGVCMLATAIALKPEKLIVAGIDLFQHPEGSYPGDSVAANAYSPGHSRDTEHDFIMHLFSGFSGEIVIVGEILRKAWESHQSSKGKMS